MYKLTSRGSGGIDSVGKNRLSPGLSNWTWKKNFPIDLLEGVGERVHKAPRSGAPPPHVHIKRGIWSRVE